MENNGTKECLRSESCALQTAAFSRRQFIRSFVVGTAFSRLAGREWFATVIADCQPSNQANGILRIQISEFPALNDTDGSVRLLFNSINPLTHLPASGSFYPLLINRGAGSQFFALNSRCTHQGCVVPTFDAAQGASVCPCHGSQYGIDGSLIQGILPGQGSLARLPIFFDGANNLLCVEVSGLGYSVTGTTVQSGGGPQFQLQFATRSGVKYQVLFRQSMSDSDPGTVVAFATTSEGAATSTVVTGNNAMATVFVDRASDAGFYSVAVQVTAG